MWLISWLFGSDRGEARDGDGNGAGNGEDDDDDDDDDDDGYRNLLVIDDGPPQIRTDFGTITALRSNFGLVDDEYPLAKSLLSKLPLCKVPLRVGNRVQYTAQRRNENQQWMVQTVVQADDDGDGTQDEWTEDRDRSDSLLNSQIEAIEHARGPAEDAESDDTPSGQMRVNVREVGVVEAIARKTSMVLVKILDDGGSSSKKLAFSLEKCPLPHQPSEGDLLSLKLKISGQDLAALQEAVIVGAAPLRVHSSGDAVVTLWMEERNQGVIDGNVYFTKSALALTYSPEEDDVVTYRAVECEVRNKNRFCNWRAVRVEPSTENFKRSKILSSVSLLSNRAASEKTEELRKPKYGVSIAPEIDLGVVRITGNRQESKAIAVFKEDSSSGNEFRISKVAFRQDVTSTDGDVSFVSLLHADNQQVLPIHLKEGRTDLIISCSGDSKYFGRHRLWCLLDVEMSSKFSKGGGDDDIACQFQLGTQVALEITNQVIGNASTSASVGGPTCWSSRRAEMEQRGQEDWDSFKRAELAQGSLNSGRNFVLRTAAMGYALPKSIPRVPVPDYLREVHPRDLLYVCPVLAASLNFSNYLEKLGNLLFLEQIVHEKLYLQLNVKGAVLKRTSRLGYFTLELKLFETRPSPMAGDYVYVMLSSTSSMSQLRRLRNDNREDGFGNVKYRGMIDAVGAGLIYLSFDENFDNSYFGELLDVFFELDTSSFMKMHNALKLSFRNFGRGLLFPEKVALYPPQINFVEKATTASSSGDDNGAVFLEHPTFPPEVKGRSFFGKDEESKTKVRTEAEAICRSLGTRRKKARGAQNLFLTPKMPLSNEDSRNLGKEIAKALNCEPQFLLDLRENRTQSSSGLKKEAHDRVALSWRSRGPNVSDATEELGTSDSDSTRLLRCLTHLPPYVPKGLKTEKSGPQVLEWCNKSLNPEQRRAVRNILSGEARPLPYIIYGPPGTGKTVTVVEAIVQLFRMRQDSRILVATQSNYSADLIVTRLHDCNEAIGYGDMARLVSWRRQEEAIPPRVKPYCFRTENMEAITKAIRHRIVISTCASSGQFYRIGIKNGHFTHCIIDEVGQTTEPESLIAISLLGTTDSQIILVGDPKQLGPVLHSTEAKTFGLEQSLLERLSRNPLYRRDMKKFGQWGGYDPMLCTKLVRSYRSHPAILKVPSDLFYDGELISEAAKEVQERALGLDFLPNPDFPLVFHGVRGHNFQEVDSPSWFNPSECFQAAMYFRHLLDNNFTNLDVCLISPYRKQNQKILEVLTSLSLPIPKICTVEEIQGQEKPAVILTTVRTLEFSELADADYARGLGFLKSEKRFNVATTRAMSVLIVIGDPHLLAVDPNWLEFIRHCDRNRACVGCDLPVGLWTDPDDGCDYEEPA